MILHHVIAAALMAIAPQRDSPPQCAIVDAVSVQWRDGQAEVSLTAAGRTATLRRDLTCHYPPPWVVGDWYDEEFSCDWSKHVEWFHGMCGRSVKDCTDCITP